MAVATHKHTGRNIGSATSNNIRITADVDHIIEHDVSIASGSTRAYAYAGTNVSVAVSTDVSTNGPGSRVHVRTDASIDDRVDLSILNTDAGSDDKIDAGIDGVRTHTSAYIAVHTRVANARHAHNHPRVSSGRVPRCSAPSA